MDLKLYIRSTLYTSSSSAVASLSWRSGEVVPGVAVSPDLYIGNLLLPRKRDGSSAGDVNERNMPVSSLVLTPTTIRNVRNLAACLCREDQFAYWAIWLWEDVILRHIASVAGQNEMIELHLDENIDSKSLLGSYVCTDVPGQFRWQAGALTQAVQKGLWVVIEDIDRAPFEVLASMVPLRNKKTRITW